MIFIRVFKDLCNIFRMLVIVCVIETDVWKFRNFMYLLFKLFVYEICDLRCDFIIFC